MSAIAALVSTDGSPASPERLGRMGEALSSLGEAASLWTGGTAGLLVRPMPLTPEDGFDRQPLVGADGRFVLAFDGRIDNRPELSGALGVDAAEARERPDSWFVLRAWERWGEEAPARLVGSFGFVVWDARERTLFAAVSASDGRTLHYGASRGLFAIATMPRGLFALPGFPRILDEVKLADYLLDLYDVSRSFFARVSVLPPGQLLKLRDGRPEVRRFWSALPAREVRFARDEEYAEALRELLDRVVRDQLRSATPVGVSLSGGLDSSAVAATAAHALAKEGRTLLAFTEVPREGFDGPVPRGRYADESPLVTAIARLHPNVDLTLVRTGPGSFLEGLTASLSHRETPFRNVFNRRWIEAVNAGARARGARVVLTGVGGNMTVSWNGASLFARLLRDGRWLRAARESRDVARAGGASSAVHALVASGVLPLIPPTARSVLRRSLLALRGRREGAWAGRSLARPEFLAEHRMKERARELNGGVAERALLGPAAARAWLLRGGSGGSFEAGCRALHGVDLRNPLFDTRLVEFCLGVPDEQCLRGGRSRWLVRRAMEGRLPREVLENRDRGLQAADWHESLRATLPALRESLDRFRRNAFLRSALDLPRLERLLDPPVDCRWDDPSVAVQYGAAFGRAVMLGSFVLWAEDEARREGGA